MCCDAMALDTWSALSLPPEGGGLYSWTPAPCDMLALSCQGQVGAFQISAHRLLAFNKGDQASMMMKFYLCSGFCSCCQTFQVDKLNMAHHYTDSDRCSLQPAACCWPGQNSQSSYCQPSKHLSSWPLQDVLWLHVLGWWVTWLG